MAQNTKRGARVDPAGVQQIGNQPDDTLLPGAAKELERPGIRVQEVALDGGFNVAPAAVALENLAPTSVFIAGR